jgi:hypothetical protein
VYLRVTLRLTMSYLVSLKVVRLLLAVSVSVWLAGGCVLGCGNAMASQTSGDTSEQAAVEGESCHRAQAHHCCSSKAKPAKQSKPAKQNRIDPKLTESLLALTTVPRGMMSDCPLAVNATAVTSKKNSNAPESAPVTNAELPIAAAVSQLPQKHVVASLLSNRGPTYLRCCVFLI